MQAIQTKYLGPTNTKGSRVKAYTWATQKTVGYLSELNSEENHARAARALAEQNGWEGNWIGGGSPDEKGYVFVDINSLPAFDISKETISLEA